MNKFDLKNFAAPEQNENSATTKEPIWVQSSSDTVKQAYDCSLKMFDEIKQNIESKIPLKVKDRKLVLATIAVKVNVDRSALTPRRTPMLCDFVKELNDELEDLWSKLNSKKITQTQTKDTLRKELSRYKRLYKMEQDKNYSDAITMMLKDELCVTNKNLIQKYTDMKVENEELKEKVSTLTARLRAYTIRGVD